MWSSIAFSKRSLATPEPDQCAHKEDRSGHRTEQNPANRSALRLAHRQFIFLDWTRGHPDEQLVAREQPIDRIGCEIAVRHVFDISVGKKQRIAHHYEPG